MHYLISITEANLILDEAKNFIKLNRSASKKMDLLRGKTQINLFFEPSTRTQSSFELAGKRLGADVMTMNVGNSSLKKGKTILDTAMTLNAMHPDIIVVSDEIYEHINFSSGGHTSFATIEGMQERTVSVNGVSKAFAGLSNKSRGSPESP